MSLSKDEIKNKEIEKEKDLDSEILEFLESRKLTKTSAYCIWDIFEEMYNIKLEDDQSRAVTKKLIEVGCAVCRLYECEKIIEINIKNDEVTYYMAK